MLPACVFVFLACALSALLGGARALPALPHRNDIDPQIAGGRNVKIEDVPWQVSVEMYEVHHCGGSIISKRWVLTAASCLSSESANLSDYNVRYGTTQKETDGTLVAVAWLGYHDRYSSDGNSYDVGLLQVVTDIEYSARAQPIMLAAVGSVPRGTDVLTVAGWGLLNIYDDEGPSSLRAVDVPYIPRATCEISYLDEGEAIDKTMICAGVGGEGTCEFDTGGALVDAFGVQVGIASWSFGCAYPGFADVYANLGDGDIGDFIRETTGIA